MPPSVSPLRLSLFVRIAPANTRFAHSRIRRGGVKDQNVCRADASDSLHAGIAAANFRHSSSDLFGRYESRDPVVRLDVTRPSTYRGHGRNPIP